MSAEVHPSERTYRNTVIRLPDLAVTESTLKDLTFENCRVVGPAVVVMMGRTMLSNCVLEGDLRSSVWEIPDDQDRVIGAIGLLDCTLVGCRFADIGFGVKSSDVEEFRKGFGSTS